MGILSRVPEGIAFPVIASVIVVTALSGIGLLLAWLF